MAQHRVSGVKRTVQGLIKDRLSFKNYPEYELKPVTYTIKFGFPTNGNVVLYRNELMMDGTLTKPEILYQNEFASRKALITICSKWNKLMKNYYDKYIFWISVEPKKFERSCYH